MGTTDKRVDAYIANSADFAKPILTFIRGAIHEGCPEVEETIKWSHVSFEYKGILAGMAAFKEHCTFKAAKPASKAKPPVEAPADLLVALKKNKKALTTFEKFSPSHKREYVEWIVEAKTDETRQRRLAQAVEWMAEGKPRNWKYM